MTFMDIGCWERGCACHDHRDKSEFVEVVLKQEIEKERERCAKILERAIVRHRYNLMHVEMLKRVHEKIVKPRSTGRNGGLSQEQLELPFGN
jgi:hypothetical protein